MMNADEYRLKADDSSLLLADELMNLTKMTNISTEGGLSVEGIEE